MSMNESAVLIRTPYGKEDLAELGDWLATHSFICVIQDAHGCIASAGEIRFSFR